MPKPPGHPTLPNDVYQEMEEVFVRLMTEKGGTHPTAANVHRALRTKKASAASVRRYVRLLKEKYSDQGGRPYPLKPWTPSWGQGKETPENIALLLGLNRLKLRAQLWAAPQSRPVGLYKHEAEWAVGIHPSLDGSHEMVELLMTLWYGERDVFAHYTQDEAHVADLNDVLAWKPWLGGRYFRDYEDVTTHPAGIATPPRVIYRSLPGDDPKVSLSGVDALLFAFCSVINDPSMIRCAVSSIQSQQGTKPSPTQDSRLALDVKGGGAPFPNAAVFEHILGDGPSPPALSLLMGHRFDSDGEQDSILDQLTCEDRNALACWLADIHGVEATDREYDLPHLRAEEGQEIAPAG
jgi:hypothetical protein